MIQEIYFASIATEVVGIEIWQLICSGYVIAHSDSGHHENWTKIFHCPMSSGASERRSERSGAQRSARAQRAVRSKRRSERCERMSERIKEWPITNILVLRPPESLC